MQTPFSVPQANSNGNEQSALGPLPQIIPGLALDQPLIPAPNPDNPVATSCRHGSAKAIQIMKFAPFAGHFAGPFQLRWSKNEGGLVPATDQRLVRMQYHEVKRKAPYPR